MKVETGDEILDKALDGGFSKNRSILVTGGPGTGKSTLAMNYLQCGIENGEKCLFITTEQNRNELKSSFSDFDFDFSSPNLTTTSVHGTPGQTLSQDSADLTLTTFDGDSMVGEEFSPPFNIEYIKHHLERFTPCDRIVFDSLSGINPISESNDTFYQIVLDLIQLFNNEFEATSLFTSEGSHKQGRTEVSGYHSSQFKFHGVLRVWRELVEGEYHRYLEILKMRGVDHDLRRYELFLNNGEIRVVPRRRSFPFSYSRGQHISTGIEGLDTLCGGGFLRGTTALITHDGNSSVHGFITSIFTEALERNSAILFVPSVNFSLERLKGLFAERVGDLDDLLDADRLFILDAVRNREEYHENTFGLQESESSIESTIRTVDERRGGSPLVSIINTETLIHATNQDRVRELRYWTEANLLRPEDTTVYTHNPKTMDETLAEFFQGGAWHVLRTWLDASGLQYIKLEKSPGGLLGSSRIVEYVDEPPYVSVLAPPYSIGTDKE